MSETMEDIREKQRTRRLSRKKKRRTTRISRKNTEIENKINDITNTYCDNLEISICKWIEKVYKPDEEISLKWEFDDIKKLLRTIMIASVKIELGEFCNETFELLLSDIMLEKWDSKCFSDTRYAAIYEPQTLPNRFWNDCRHLLNQ